MYANQYSRNIFTRRDSKTAKEKVDQFVFGVTLFLGTIAVLFLPWGGQA